MTRMILLLVLTLAISSCNPPCSVNDLYGADEFVLDSYKIREGKFAILEMQQIEVEELGFDSFNETAHSEDALVLGAVKPSYIEADGKVSLYDLLSKLDLATTLNLYKSYVLRDKKRLPIDFAKLLQEGDMEQNIVISGGDQIYLSDDNFAKVTVFGDQVRSCTILLPSGKMSLKEVLGEVGGLLDPQATIQVIRGSMSRPKIYSLHLDHILHLPNESLLVMDGDTIYISRKPLTREGLFAYDGLYR